MYVTTLISFFPGDTLWSVLTSDEVSLGTFDLQFPLVFHISTVDIGSGQYNVSLVSNSSVTDIDNNEVCIHTSYGCKFFVKVYRNF